jgi:hypothetical protein
MMSAISSSSSGNDAYRSQVAQKQSDRQLASLSRSLKSSENIGKAAGVDTSAVEGASKKISGTSSTTQAAASSKVTLSSAGVSKLKAEEAANAKASTAESKVEKKQFKSIDEAISYGAGKATEQASKKLATNNSSITVAGTNTAKAATAPTTTVNAKSDSTEKLDTPAKTDSANANASASKASGKKQFKSVDEAIAYGATKANEQADLKKKKVTEAANEAAAVKSSYSSTKAIEQYGKVASA